MGKTIFVDIDNTICVTNGVDYASAVPKSEVINLINSWHSLGHKIVYWSARGALTGKDWMPLTKSQLSAWGCKYDEVRLDKPLFDQFYDDRAWNAIELEMDSGCIGKYDR